MPTVSSHVSSPCCFSRRLLRTAIVLSVIIGAAPGSHAQRKIHRELTVDNGLIQSQVNAVHEDSDGFVWFGTFGGLSRWDGRSFMNVDNLGGLAGQDVRLFVEAPDGRLLVGTYDGGISVYYRDANRFETVDEDDGLLSNSIRAIQYHDAGAVYVGTSAGVTVYASDRFDTVSDSLLVGLSISAITPRPEGGLYVSTFRDGVFIVDDGPARPFPEELPEKVIRFVHTARDGTLYLSVYRNGVWTYRDGVLAQFAGNDALVGVDVKAICEARDGSLYLSTLGRGVAVYKDGAIEWIGPEEGLGSDTSWGVAEGASGVVYLCSWGGVSFYYPHRTESIGVEHGLPAPVVTAFCETADGRMFIGTPGGVAMWQDGLVKRTYTTADGLANNRVWSMLARANGDVYVGTAAGVSVIKGESVETLYGERDIMQGRVYAMHEARDGRVIFATYEGVMVETADGVVPLFDEPGLVRSTIFSIHETGAGVLYFGTGGGVTVVDGANVSYLPGAIAEQRVFAVAGAGNGTMLFGTNASGAYVAGDSMHLSTRNGLSNNTVYGIAVTDSAWYMTTHRGLNIVYPNRDFQIRTLRHADGLASEECVQGALLIDSRNRLWIGTIRGATIYDPSRDPRNKRAPRVLIKRVRLFDDELPLARFQSEESFRWNENYFRFDFVGTNPYAPEKVTYRYRLIGIDRQWISATEPLVQYTALPAGDYHLEVAAANGWGVWSDPTVLAFSIAQPFWKTWWFISLALLVVGGAIALVVSYRVRHLLAIERLRARIAADLHDDLGAGLTEISIMSELTRHSLSEDSMKRAGNNLETIAGTARALVTAMSDIVWLVNPRRDSVHDLITRLGDTFRDTMDAAGIALEMNGVDQLPGVQLSVEKRQHLYMILKEAIHNAVKHSGATAVLVDSRVEGNTLSVSVSDNGTGYDATAAHSGNGLANMKERAAAIGGRLQVESTTDGGARVSFSAPL